MTINSKINYSVDTYDHEEIWHTGSSKYNLKDKPTHRDNHKCEDITGLLIIL